MTPRRHFRESCIRQRAARTHRTQRREREIDDGRRERTFRKHPGWPGHGRCRCSYSLSGRSWTRRRDRRDRSTAVPYSTGRAIRARTETSAVIESPGAGVVTCERWVRRFSDQHSTAGVPRLSTGARAARPDPRNAEVTRGRCWMRLCGLALRDQRSALRKERASVNDAHGSDVQPRYTARDFFHERAARYMPRYCCGF